MNRNKSKPIGLGTKVMLIGITFIAGYSFLSKPNTPDRIYFEPDKSGQLRKTERSKPLVATNAPLWKPEPQFLLSRTNDLKLTERQQLEIERIATNWLNVKAKLESRMASAASAVGERSPTKMSLAALNGNLSGYSELSKTYNRIRNKHWSSAIAILSEDQRVRLESALQAEKEAKR